MPNVGLDADFERLGANAEAPVYLIDTHVISEIRKGGEANLGVAAFFQRLKSDNEPAFLSAVTVGELRGGVELIQHR